MTRRAPSREVAPPPPRHPGECQCVLLDPRFNGRDACGGFAVAPDVPYCRECLAQGHPHHEGQQGPRRGSP